MLTAGASDQLVADSGSQPGHSAFTGALLDGLKGRADLNNDGITSASDLANFVKAKVIRESAAASSVQTPYFNYLSGSGQGNCYSWLRTRRSRWYQQGRSTVVVAGKRVTLPLLVVLVVLGVVMICCWLSASCCPSKAVY